MPISWPPKIIHQRALQAFSAWQDIDTSTEPIDRAVAETVIGDFYESIGLKRPRCAWTPSPRASLRAIAGLRTAEIAMATHHFFYRDIQPQETIEPWLDEAFDLMIGLPETMRRHAASLESNRQITNFLTPRFERADCTSIRSALWLLSSIKEQPLEEATRSYLKKHHSRLYRRSKLMQNVMPIAMQEALFPFGLSDPESGLGYDPRQILKPCSEYYIGSRAIPYDEAFLDMVIQHDDSNSNRQARFYLATLRACPLWIPFNGQVVISDRPVHFATDPDLHPHSETGPAIAYQDGFSLYFWHGHAVNRQMIDDMADLTPERIQDQSNAEWRRLMMEHYGVGRYLHNTGAQVVDVDQVEVTLGSDRFMIRCLLRDRDGNQYLEGTDGSTQRCYFMSVDPTVANCRDAHTSISGLNDSHCIAQA